MVEISSYQQNAPARRVICRVMAHDEVSPSYWRLKLQDTFIANSSRAGQFVHLLARTPQVFDPLLRRAFSILRTESDYFEVLYRVGGRGTQNMALLCAGDEVDVIAPLGHGFRSNDEDVVLVGGGVGVPPLAMLARQRFMADFTSATEVIVGARTQSDILCQGDFAQCNIVPRVATEDGSVGSRGYVTHLLQESLEQREMLPIVQACGPWAMLRAVAALCAERNVPCQVSMEENMPCGVGVCNGCVVKMSEGEDEYSMYRRICVDGPVVWAHEVDWNQ